MLLRLFALFVQAFDEFVALLGQAVRLANGSHIVRTQLLTDTDDSPSQTERSVKERAAPNRLPAVPSRSVTSLATAGSLLLRALERRQLMHALQVKQSAEAGSATDAEASTDVVNGRRHPDSHLSQQR